ncbi:hypothetical protein GCM10009533_59140 [Saccharopolyspora spinosporotrichia]|uniref:Uncharacterized protein n=1 Tax=Saccharopolyspora erythraea TaxID=1836 RepID=A0ABP3NXP0_SACER
MRRNGSCGVRISPHPNTHGFVPDDGDLVDLLAEFALTETDRRRLLVDNPAECFDFPH